MITSNTLSDDNFSYIEIYVLAFELECNGMIVCVIYLSFRDKNNNIQHSIINHNSSSKSWWDKTKLSNS